MIDPLQVQERVRRQVRRRRRWRRLRIAVSALAVTAAVVAAAYGIDRLAVAVHKFYDEHHHPAPVRATGAGKGTTTTTTTSVPGPPRCDSPQLSAVVSDWRELSATVQEVVALTNISATPCTLAGYPSLGVVAQTGTPLPAPTTDVASLDSPATVGSTTPPTPVTLVHAARASFELSFTNTCDHVLPPGAAATGVPNECYAGVWLEVTPPLGAGALLVTEPLRLTYATAGFQVGPFLAGDGPPLSGQPPLTSPTTSAPPAP
jgi:hypothetical protein